MKTCTAHRGRTAERTRGTEAGQPLVAPAQRSLWAAAEKAAGGRSAGAPPERAVLLEPPPPPPHWGLHLRSHASCARGAARGANSAAVGRSGLSEDLHFVEERRHHHHVVVV
ncbi:unnamed protein product, partial [Prorocentrum cordatum]